jgi:hypothetical protein
MSTTNHNILYFGHISGINFPNKGDSLWKAPNSLARRGVKPAKSASIPVQSWPALPSLSNSSLALTAPGGNTQKRCTSVLRLWELWRFGTVPDWFNTVEYSDRNAAAHNIEFLP